MQKFIVKKSAVFFFTNLLVIRSEGKISKDGQTEDRGWDGDWEAVGLKEDFCVEETQDHVLFHKQN